VNETPAPVPPAAPPGRRSWRIPAIIAGAAALVLVVGLALYLRSAGRVSKDTLAATPKQVVTVAARAGSYRQVARYVSTIEPWIEARVGPQLVSAYVDEVRVRPGAVVRKGEVLATLDCRNASAESKALAAQSRAVEARHQAVAHEAARVGELLGGGFVSPNEAEQKTAESVSKEAELQSSRARVARSTLEVEDCVLRAPFDGEVGARAMDPGAFARPGSWVVTVVDRSTVRIVTDVPELDFPSVAPGTPATVRVLSTGASVPAKISRRSPSADRSTRTIHVEVDVADPSRQLPVYTTAEVAVEAGKAVQATSIPLTAATIRGDRASVMVVEDGHARRRVVDVVGESQGTLYVASTLPHGTPIVTEGRAVLKDGDPVQASPAPAGAPAAAPASPPTSAPSAAPATPPASKTPASTGSQR
jgi:membrane fusion protein, multidrug efflux system